MRVRAVLPLLLLGALLPPAARAMLDLLAWLAPEPLPRFLFDHDAAPEGTENLFADSADPQEILGGLIRECRHDGPGSGEW